MKGDIVVIELPMPVRRVLANDKVTEDRGKVALQRGPVVYCAEWIDNGGRVTNLILPDDIQLSNELRPGLLNGVAVITGSTRAFVPGENGQSVTTEKQVFIAVPYYAWSHRGTGEMSVWLPRKIGKIKVIAAE